MPVKINYPSVLKTIKGKLEVNKMSALVGAGFSKNFDNDIFPSWWQLLREMVNETQGDSIKERFNNHFKGKDRKKASYEHYLNENLDKYIDAIGPLKAVSDYILKKGYREAVDFKIEEATPVVDIEDHKKFITYRQNGEVIKREILSSELRVHEKFVALPWNNIYTTNYDNLLESSIDFNIKKTLDAQVKELQDKIEKDGKELECIDLEINNLNKILESQEDSYTIDTEQTVEMQNGLGVSLKNINELRNNRDKNYWKKKRLESSIQSITGDLNNFVALQDEFSSLVRHSADLALKKNGNIIKIHGSVRTAMDRVYGFDGDIRKHYVISQEDFDTYPQKHVAFTQLMRIALLQEAFLIVGFSGIDPNFLAWIDWVRDVIERKAEKGSPGDKIYLISINEEPIFPDRELFYINHGIVVVQLTHFECLNFLQRETGRQLPGKPSSKEMIELFIDFLSQDVKPNRFRTAYELLQQQKYKTVIRELPNSSNDEISITTTEKMLARADEICLLKTNNRIPDFRLDIMYPGLNYIRMSNKFLNTLEGDQLRAYLKILFGIIDDQLLPLSFLFKDTIETKELLKKTVQKVSGEYYENFQLLELKEAVLGNDIRQIKTLKNSLLRSKRMQIDQELIFQSALHAFYNFEFSRYEEIIFEWNAIDHWILKKAYLIAHIDSSFALELLKSYEPVQLTEQVYQFERMTMYSNWSNNSNRTKYQEKVKKLEGLGFAASRENVRTIIETLNKEKKIINPYGHEKNTVTHTTIFTERSDVLDSLKLFIYMNEVGFPISVPGVNYFDAAQLHKPFELLYETFPFPVLSLLCQFGNDKLTQRLAQDYSCSKKLASQVNALSKSIQKGCLDELTPHHFKKQLLIFYSEFLNVIPIEDWESFFVKIWKKERQDDNLFAEHRLDINPFLINGLRYISKSPNQIMVINDCLDIINRENLHDSESAVRYLYVLAINKKRQQNSASNSIGINQRKLKKVIKRLSDYPDLIFILSNINYLIDENSQMDIVDMIKSKTLFTNLNPKIWGIYFYFLNNEKLAKNRLKNKLIKSKELWDAGFINENTITTANNYISLYDLRSVVKWNKEEAKSIFDRLVSEVERIEREVERSAFYMNYRNILKEMIFFMEYEEAKIGELENYAVVLQRLIDLYHRQREYKDLTQGLISKDKTHVITAINELSHLLQNLDQVSLQDDYIRLVINKLILKSPGGLPAAFGTFSDWLIRFRHNEYFKSLLPLIEKVIEVYYPDGDSEFDAPFLEEKLIQIAYVLNRWGSKLNKVQELLELLDTSRFNSTKHHLKYRIDDLDSN